MVSPTKQGAVTPRKKEIKSPSKEIDKIQEAIKFWGTNEDDLIDVLARRNNKQRQELKKQYTEKYKKDLSEVLKSELSGDFEELILALLMTPSEYDAHCLHNAVRGLGTDENVLITILATRSSKVFFLDSILDVSFITRSNFILRKSKLYQTITVENINRVSQKT